MVAGKVVRQAISRTNDYGQAGERYRTFEAWEQDELIIEPGRPSSRSATRTSRSGWSGT